jgi:hypothetical protein
VITHEYIREVVVKLPCMLIRTIRSPLTSQYGSICTAMRFRAGANQTPSKNRTSNPNFMLSSFCFNINRHKSTKHKVNQITPKHQTPNTKNKKLYPNPILSILPLTHLSIPHSNPPSETPLFSSPQNTPHLLYYPTPLLPSLSSFQNQFPYEPLSSPSVSAPPPF